MASKITTSTLYRIFIALITTIIFAATSLWILETYQIKKEQKNLLYENQLLQQEIDSFSTNLIDQINNFLNKNTAILEQLDLLKNDPTPENIALITTLLESEPKMHEYQDIIFVSASQQISFLANKQIPGIEPINQDDITLRKNLINLAKQANILVEPTLSYIFFENTKVSLFVAIACIYDQTLIGTYIVGLPIDLLSPSIKKFQLKLFNDKITVATKQDFNAFIIYATEQRLISTTIPFKSELPITLALQGNFNNQITTVDHRSFITASGYSLKSNLAITIEQPVSQLFIIISIFKKLLNLLLIIAILLLCSILFLKRKNIYLFCKTRYHHLLLFGNLLVLCVIGICIVNLIQNYKFTQSTIHAQKKQEAKENIQYAISLLLEQLHEVQQTSNLLAQNFSALISDKKNLESYISKIVTENKFLVGVAVIYNKTEDSLLPGAKEVIFSNNGDSIKTIPVKEMAQWYIDALKQESTWIGPVIQKELNETVIIYTKHTALGTIATLYSYEALKELIMSIETSLGNNFFITSSDGKIIYYQNIKAIIENSLTIQDMTKLLGNPNLEYIQTQGAKGDSGSINYFDAATSTQQIIFYESIPITNWIGVFFFKDSDFFNFNLQLFHIVFWIILLIAIFLMLISLLCINLYRSFIHFLNFSFLISTFLQWLAIFSLLILTSYFFNVRRSDDAIAKNEVTKIIEQKLQKNSNLIPVRVGIIIDYLKLNENKLKFTARIWQKVDDPKYFNLIQGINFKNNQGEITATQTFKTIKNNSLTIQWEVKGEVIQPHALLNLYPFDSQTLQLVMEPKNLKNLLLMVPDFYGYSNSLDPKKEGITKDLLLDGFSIKETYFTISEQQALTETAQENIPTFSLTFNMVAKRGILEALLRYILPYFLIMITVFILFSLIKQRDIKLIQYYAGLSFTLVLVHNNLRTYINANQVTYLESILLAGYLILILASINVLLKTKSLHYAQLKNSLLWFIYTIIIFTLTFMQIYRYVV